MNVPKIKNKSYKIFNGFPSSQCDWVVKQFTRFEGWDSIAEFWDKKDAKLFIKAKLAEKRFL